MPDAPLPAVRSDRLKIAFVLDDTLDKSDGVQQAVVTLGNWMRLQGHVVHYLVADTTRGDIANIHSLGRFVNLKFNKNNVRAILPAKRKKIKALLDHEQFDVIHVMMPFSPLMGKMVVDAAGPQTAIVGTFHTLPASKSLHYANHALSLALNKSLKRFDTIMAVSEPVVKFARSAYRVPAVFVPNPVVLEDFRTGKHLGEFRRNKSNIVFLGRLVQRKGIIELIKAYNALPDDIAKQTRLIVGGKGPLRKKAQAMVAPNREVIFKGFIAEKDKADFLASADIAVFPSTTGEAFGIVLIEAMAAGSGVVLGGDNPGYHSVLGEQPYMLFKPKDTAAFAEHLQLFITDSRLRDRLHQWQERAVLQYDINVVGKSVEKIYTAALRERADVSDNKTDD